MKFKLVESIPTEAHIGDVVFLRKDKPYKSEQTKQLIDNNHQFFVVSENGNNILVLMTTSNVGKIEKRPTSYIKISGSKKDFLVELNTWGTFTKDYVQRVSETLSDDDTWNIMNAFYNSDSPTDLKLEGLR